MAVKHVTDGEFATEVLQRDKTVLVDFWAEWCGPCRQLSPILDDLATEMDEKIEVSKVNIDENPDTPIKYGVRGIPTLILFKNGEPVATKVGSLPKTQLKQWIESNLG